ncbi:MAG: nucleoside 2-deoxyribosyltransferase [Planctomycetes bacterium]|nr:nucleoside 2-deoxyribosyltransferase [Planctomycetota bacterium]MCD7896111.1 nucleoside 2-deoxyribosyltransferase [Planctomycetaceae bacterium]
MRIYFAASLFTHMESRWNRDVAEALERIVPGLKIVLPQDFDVPGRHGDTRRYGKIFTRCYEAIDGCDAMVAILEGAEVDSGTAWEVGYAFAKKIPVVGVRTDFRPGADSGVNVMLARSCRCLVNDVRFDKGVDDIAKRIARALAKLSLRTGTAKKAGAATAAKKTAKAATTTTAKGGKKAKK